MPPPQQKLRFTKGGIVGAILTVLAGVCALNNSFTGLVNLSYDLNFFFRPDIPVEDAAIIYMDVESHTRLGVKPDQLWSRALHADLIDTLSKAGARAIVFDVLFRGGDEGDNRLNEAARSFGKVVVAGAVRELRGPHGEFVGSVLDKPSPELGAITNWGLPCGPMPEDKEYVRRHYARKDLDAPSLAWKAAQTVLTNVFVSKFPEQWRWINYYGPTTLWPRHSYWEALNTNTSSSKLSETYSNKVVFVGKHLYVGTGSGKEVDEHRTPYTRWTGRKSPGPEINATAYLNIVRGDWLERTSLFTDLLMVLALGSMLGFGLARLSPVRSVSLGLGCILVMGLIAYVITWTTHVWFPWLVVSVVQVPVAVGWSVLNQTRRLVLEKRALEQSMALPSLARKILSPTAVVPGQELAGDKPLEPQGADTLSVPDYMLVRRIGQGAYGDVYLAQDAIGSYRAVKILHRRHFQEARPFEREFYGLKRFAPISNGHPGLVQVLHVGKNERNQYFYYVMELADDEASGRDVNPQHYTAKNLAGELQHRQRLPLSECLDISMRVADALAYLHGQHLIHRDIKPANIIFVNGRPKLADIGLVTETASLGPVTFVGTEGYIPPEGPGTAQADIYSLGKVIYQLASGFPLERFPELPTALMEDVVGDFLMELNGIILLACETDPARRYKSAAELKDALFRLAQKLS